MTAESSNEGQIFRTFWHGGPLSQYQIFCLRSFVARGHRIEVFSYEDGLAVPDWIVRKDAREILPADRVLHYRSGFGQGSPSLHSNLFRYTMLHRLGGWWIDTDVVLFGSQLSLDPVFFIVEDPHSGRCGTAVLKLPRQHPLLSEAIERCLAMGEAATWGQTGPGLFTKLVNEYQLARYASPQKTAYSIFWWDFAAFFDPDRCDEVRSCCKESTFIHLWNEMWRQAGIPSDSAPPQGSYLDWLINYMDFDIKFRGRLQFVITEEGPRFIKDHDPAL
jgi:hypothetical protein